MVTRNLNFLRDYISEGYPYYVYFVPDGHVVFELLACSHSSTDEVVRITVSSKSAFKILGYSSLCSISVLNFKY